MILDIDLSRMTHLEDISCYNYNFYSYGNCGLKLLQVCDEEAEQYNYYLIDGDHKVFLGCTDGDEQEIEFMIRHT